MSGRATGVDYLAQNGLGEKAQSQHSLDNETVYDYLNKLESAYILHRCFGYDIKGKEILITQEEFYLSDPALKYSALGYSSTTANAMLENIVYLELLRRDYDVCIGKLGNFEIDFVATKMDKYVLLKDDYAAVIIRESRPCILQIFY